MKESLLLILIGLISWGYIEYDLSAGPIQLTEDLEDFPTQIIPDVFESRDDAMVALEEMFDMMAVEPPVLRCEELVGEEQFWPGNPRPQIACYSNMRGIFYWSFWNEERFEPFAYSDFPSQVDARIFSSAADLEIVFVANNGTMARYKITAENTVITKYCIQPLCLRV